MRVIAGAAKGTRLKVPKRVTRPSTDRLREALFSILAPRMEGARVLDLFAGSGALGIEALSRGAVEAVMVDSSGQAGEVIRENLAKARLGESGTVAKSDVFRWIERNRGRRFDVIFADPPYASNAEEDLAARLLADENLPGLLADDGLVVVEVESEREAPTGRAEWTQRDRRVYGSSAILFYAREESE